MRGALLALAFALLSSSAMADFVSSAPDSVQVTIYRDAQAQIAPYARDEQDDDEEYGEYTKSDRAALARDENGLVTGLAMVTETRTIDIPAGTSKLIFRGVADAIVPQTAGVEGLPAVILESNFDYDLLTPGAVIAKSHGEHVRLVRTDSATGRVIERDAIIRSGPEGVVLDIGGTIEALDCSGLDEKIVFDRIPAGLADEPTLSMIVRAPQAGRHTIRLSYLALGLDWSADYVATINPDRSTLNLTGWITLINRASTTFANAPTEVVAGELAREKAETQPPGANTIERQSACWPVGSFSTFVASSTRAAGSLRRLAYAAPMADQLQEAIVTGRRVALEAKLSQLGDYKLYTLPEPTTVAARQSKQIRFLSQDNVPFERIYTFRFDEYSMTGSEELMPSRPTVTLRLQNEKSRGLGKPLPAGTLSTLEPADQGHPILAGQDRLKDTAVGLPLDIELGTALDVWVEPLVAENGTIEHGDHEDDRAVIEVRFGNDKPVPVVLEYRHRAMGDFRIVSESKRHTLKSGDPQWTFRLQPGARAVLRYTREREG